MLAYVPIDSWKLNMLILCSLSAYELRAPDYSSIMKCTYGDW